jgi:hypothetical protein
MLLFPHPALAQFSQQGPKLVGTGAVGNAYQGGSVSLSADGNTAIVGGFGDNDNNYAGAAWVWTRSGGIWIQQGTKLVGSGNVGQAQQGISVSLSADGSTALVGGPYDNITVGAACVFAAAEASSANWANSYGQNSYSDDKIYSVRQTQDGGFVFAGYIYDNTKSGLDVLQVWIAKLDSFGNIQWQKKYGGGVPSFIQQTSDGQYIVAGSTWPWGANVSDAFVLKLDEHGDVIWKRVYGGNKDDYAKDIQQTADGGYILAGSSNSFTSSNAAWILKLDSVGNIHWSKTYNGSHELNSLKETSDGGYIAAGSTYFGSGKGDGCLLKLNSLGSIEWQKAYGGTEPDSFSSVSQTPDGGYIATGAGGDDVRIIKLNSSGDIVWQKTYGGITNDFFASVVEQTNDGGYIVAGGISNQDSQNGNWDGWVLKLNSGGQISWQKTYGRHWSGRWGGDLAYAVQQTSDGGYTIALSDGFTFFGNNDPSVLLKVDANGEIGNSCGIIGLSAANVADTNIAPMESSAIVTDATATVTTAILTPQASNATMITQCSYASVVATISPTSHDFGNLNPGMISPVQTFTLTNSTADSLTPSASLSGSNLTEFQIRNDNCSGKAITPSGTCTVDVIFSPVSYGPKAATLAMVAGTSSVSASLTGTGGATGNSTISGTVYNQSYQPLSGALVKLATKTFTTGADGSYSFTDITPGNVAATVTKSGYAKVTETVSIPPYATVTKDFRLATASASEVRINDISTKYEGFLYFMTGTSFNVTFIANVDWGMHPAGKVRFITSKGTYEVTTSGTKASRTIDVGTEFQPCATLKAVAVSSDGAQSAEAEADFTMMSPVIGGLPFARVDLGDGFFYQTKYGFNLDLIDEGIADGVIPEDFPLFGNKGINLRFVPTVEAEIESNGSAGINLDWQSKPLVKGDLGGIEYSLDPKLNIDGKFTHPGCFYKWTGSAGLKGEVKVSKSWPFIFMAGPVPVPMYAKASIELTADAAVVVENINPVKLNGLLGINPYVRGSLGAGADKLLAVEGWIGGGADMQLQYPQIPHLKDTTLYLNGGVTVYALLWEWENELLRWDWNLNDAAAYRANAGMSLPLQPRLLPRIYLLNPSYGLFLETPVYSVSTATPQAGRYQIETSPLQVSVFPYSEANLSSNGTKLSLAYLTDNASRASINRTMAVFSSFNSTSWRAPQAIADDGTADFHPDTLTFSGGSVIAAWENGKAALPDTATFEDTVKNMEIAISVYDPSTKTWSAQQVMTDNAYIDMAPRLSGKAKTNSMLVWVANETNNLAGNAANPNKLWYAKYNGTAWTAPKLITEIPYGLLKYSFIFSPPKARVVLSLDTDGDTSTVNDHELFMLSYESGVWGSLTRLTDDTVPDDNPQLALDPAGKFVLVWLKGNEVSSILDFDFASRTVIRTDEYSSNLADFKLASSSDGKISLVWAEPAEYSSDLYSMFYDPALKVWGSPSQLTSDTETERHITAAYYGNDTLIAVYNRNEVSQQQMTRTAANGKVVTYDVPVTISTDLYMLKHTMANDLALDAGSLIAGPANPEPGKAVTFTVTARNAGDSPAEDAVVAFYNGDPGSGGTEIGRVTIADPLKPGDAPDVLFSWTVPQATAAPVSIYAIIDPDSLIDTENRTNNSLNIAIVKPDLAIANVSWEKLTDTLITMKARIINTGSLSTGANTATFRKGSISGQILKTENITNLERLQSYDVSFIWDVSAIPAASYAVVITADEGNTVAEFDETNNTETLTVDGFSPTALSATATSSSKIILSWTDRAANETGFKIERKEGVCSSTNPWAEITIKGANVTTHTDNGLIAGTAYSYRIRAYNAAVNSAYSTCATATTGKTGAPNSPTGLMATATTANAVTMKWTDASSNETRFEVWRKVDTGTFSKIGQTAKDIKNYQDATATGSNATTSYQYYMRACNVSGCSPATKTAIVPFKPTTLSATAASGKIVLLWTDNSSNEAGFQVYRKAGACRSTNTWGLINTTPANSETYTDTGMAAGQYSYHVRAYSKSAGQPFASGYSMFTGCVSATEP